MVTHDTKRGTVDSRSKALQNDANHFSESTEHQRKKRQSLPTSQGQNLLSSVKKMRFERVATQA